MSVTEAQTLFQQALEQHRKGELAQAQLLYEEILKTQPRHFDALHLLGVIAVQMNKHLLAVELITKAIEVNPNHPSAYSNRGMALKGLNRLDEAVASYDRAIALRPDYADAYFNRGNTLQGLKRLDDALASYEKAIMLRPDCDFQSGTLLLTRMKLCEWRGLADNLRNLEADIRSFKKTSPPFETLALLDSPELHKQAAEMYAETLYPQREQLGKIEKRARRDRIHVGYFSADFHNHAVSYLMAELFEIHDPARFELFGFSFGPDTQDEMRKRVSAAFDTFIDVRDKSDREVAEQREAWGKT